MNMIRGVVVDDEPLGRRKLVRLLEHQDGVQIVSECSGGAEAIAAIQSHLPDVVFLDIDMPEVDGFDVLEALSTERLPQIIFVTAHARFAVRAFEAQAIDYLLKPFSADRLRRAIDRARERISQNELGCPADVAALAEALRTARNRVDRVDRVAVTAGRRTQFVNIESVDWIESVGNYLQLHASGASHLIRGTVKGMEDRLDSRQFLRINRSTIVNLHRVAEIVAKGGGDYLLVLNDGTRLSSGWGYGRRVREIIEGPF